MIRPGHFLNNNKETMAEKVNKDLPRYYDEYYAVPSMADYRPPEYPIFNGMSHVSSIRNHELILNNLLGSLNLVNADPNNIAASEGPNLNYEWNKIMSMAANEQSTMVGCIVYINNISYRIISIDRRQRTMCLLAVYNICKGPIDDRPWFNGNYAESKLHDWLNSYYIMHFMQQSRGVLNPDNTYITIPLMDIFNLPIFEYGLYRKDITMPDANPLIKANFYNDRNLREFWLLFRNISRNDINCKYTIHKAKSTKALDGKGRYVLDMAKTIDPSNKIDYSKPSGIRPLVIIKF